MNVGMGTVAKKEVTALVQARHTYTGYTVQMEKLNSQLIKTWGLDTRPTNVHTLYEIHGCIHLQA